MEMWEDECVYRSWEEDEHVRRREEERDDLKIWWRGVSCGKEAWRKLGRKDLELLLLGERRTDGKYEKIATHSRDIQAGY
jgi:hypothetical protein